MVNRSSVSPWSSPRAARRLMLLTALGAAALGACSSATSLPKCSAGSANLLLRLLLKNPVAALTLRSQKTALAAESTVSFRMPTRLAPLRMRDSYRLMALGRSDLSSGRIPPRGTAAGEGTSAGAEEISLGPS